MANELNVGYSGALTVYAVIRRVADAYAWDAANAAWEAWADGSIGDYDIPLTDQGGSLYAEDFPAGISAGTRVVVTYYEQQAAAPAVTDFVLRTWEGTWTGVLTESGAAGTGLVTLARAQLSPRLAAVDEDLLNALILGVTAFLENVCNRVFASTTHTEVHDGCGDNTLILHNPPVTTLTAITILDANGDETEIDGDEFRVEAGAGIVRFKPNTTADYSSFPVGFQNVSAVYIGGWETIEEDLQMAAVELIELAVEQSPGVSSEKMGDYAVVFNTAFQGLSPLSRAAVSHYRRIRV